ncbi:MAG: hypothetical protein JWM53_3623 [bacterium]|nr:hypothetical protein [bacterium]
MRKMIGIGLVALLAGCGAAESPTGDATGNLLVRRCPDPSTDCTQSNGTGVYTAEDGYAGIDTGKMMITRFINHGSYVTLGARYFDAAANLWLAAGGSVSSADYLGKKGLQVIAVRESSTTPIWTLLDSATNTTTNVIGAQLLDLKVIITPDASAGGSKQYELSFDKFATDISGKQPVRTVNMRWRAAYSNVVPTQYCVDASNQPDPVVFQQGMAVNPVNAAVTRNSTTDGVVTLSCRLGAMATVHSWGYAYRTPYNTFYFDAGLQMKRASYCADANHYTTAGTKIQIADDSGIQSDTITYLESWWTPQGALCLDNPRHWNAGFSGSCNGQPLPHCVNRPAQYLADGPAILQP